MKDKKVLIIDPDFESVKSLHQLLKDFECQVIVAYDGEQGLEKAKTEDPDLIILEAMLPRLKGFDICAIIANDFERKIPIVILSEFYQDFKDIILQKFGAEALLKKPVDKEELHYTLFDLLKKRQEKEAYSPFISPSGLNGKSDGGNNGKDHKKKIDVDMLFKKIISEFEVRQERKRPAA
jgi:DNA-binding response OmpR family regulator